MAPPKTRSARPDRRSGRPLPPQEKQRDTHQHKERGPDRGEDPRGRGERGFDEPRIPARDIRGGEKRPDDAGHIGEDDRRNQPHGVLISAGVHGGK